MDWLRDHVGLILWATGIPTAGAILLALFPEDVLRFLGLPPERTLVARHAGVLIAVFGVGLVWAAIAPEVRRPVLALTLAEKAGFVLLVAAQGRRSVSARLAAIAAFDLACVVLFALCLTA